MQLILDPDNSDIYIKEKMTSVDSIEKTINGVCEIPKSPEKEKVSDPDKENKSNEDNDTESQNNMESGDKAVLEEAPEKRCENTPENQIIDKEKVSNSDNQDNIAQFCEGIPKNNTTEKHKVPNSDNKNGIALRCEDVPENESLEKVSNSDKENIMNGNNIGVPVPLCDNASKQHKVSHLDTENSLDVNVIQENIETGDKLTIEEVPRSENFSEGPSKTEKSNIEREKGLNSDIFGAVKQTKIGGTNVRDALALPCEDIYEKESIEFDEESRLRLDSYETARKINSNEKSHADISNETELTLDQHEEEKSENCFKEQLNDEKNIVKKQNENENFLKTEDPEKLTEQHIKGIKNLDNALKQTETTAELCNDIENQNINETGGCKAVDNKVGNNDSVKDQFQQCIIDMKECNLEKKSIDKVSYLIPESEKIAENTAADVQTVIVSFLDNSDMSTIECSDLKQADIMEYDEIVASKPELNESTLTAMDCDRDDIDFKGKKSTENLSDNTASIQITTKEYTQVVKTNCLENDSTAEVAEKVTKDVKEYKETKDTFIITESTVVEKMDTFKESENIDKLKKIEVPDQAVEANETTSSFNNIKDTDVKEESVPDALSITDSPCKGNSDIEEVKVIDIDQEVKSTATPVTSKIVDKPTPVVKLSNTLNILSDDEDEPPNIQEIQTANLKANDNKQCIDIEDDDDVMVIEDTPRQDKPIVSPESTLGKKDDFKSDSDGKISEVLKETVASCNNVTESAEPQSKLDESSKATEKMPLECTGKIKDEPPLLPKDLFKSYKKNLTEMTRDDLEEFCILKIVESIIDRSSVNEIKTKLKTMSQTIEEYKKKAMMLTKQNRDLQVVLKSVQEEQKKGGDAPIVPLKITRSVGMQVLMTDKNARRKVMPTPIPGPSSSVNNRPIRNVNQSPRQQKPVNATNQQIPVPRLVPATNNAAVNKTPAPSQVAATRNSAKPNNSIPNGVRTSPPAPKSAEKRGRSQSITVDLTDDEPPPKVPVPPVRVVPSQNLLTPRAQMITNPGKVYIPIGSNQNPVRPGQTIMLKNVPNTGPRPRGTAPMATRAPTPNQIRMNRVPGRHPAPLPDAVKQYQPPNWKALPPAPDLKLSKVENGIVISWKIDGYQEDSYEEIASYQLYAYQETSSPPNTSLWKKIGDVKALPLPMACTLTQFMAGYKYYFAVRAVDIRSRLGPFSLPGSILLLNKM